MRRMTETQMTREECLWEAENREWLADNARTYEAWAKLMDTARYFRSVALIAKPAAENPKPGA